MNPQTRPGLYSSIRPVTNESSVREDTFYPDSSRLSELALQACWFNGDFGFDFETTDGMRVRVVEPGVWNRESGPDFIEAVVAFGDGPPQRGAVELDRHPLDWERHGHSVNPAFENVLLHLCFEKGSQEVFARTASNRHVPRVRLDATRIGDLAPLSIAPAHPGRCRAPLFNAGSETACEIIEAAARFRLERKQKRLRRLIEVRGEGQAIYQGIASALGYKENTLAFGLVSQRLPIKELRAKSGESEALLFGLAGFLPKRELGSEASREYLRGLWEKWWPHRGRLGALELANTEWKRGGSRPVNHPERRLGALSRLVAEWPAFFKTAKAGDATEVTRFLGGLSHPFWDWHCTLRSRPLVAQTALIGESRIGEILANVLYPWWISTSPERWGEYANLPAVLSNRKVTTAAIRLFGSEKAARPMMRTVAHQQGLLQIYEDFCLRDLTGCDQCPFPERVEGWKRA